MMQVRCVSDQTANMFFKSATRGVIREQQTAQEHSGDCSVPIYVYIMYTQILWSVDLLDWP